MVPVRFTKGASAIQAKNRQCGLFCEMKKLPAGGAESVLLGMLGRFFESGGLHESFAQVLSERTIKVLLEFDSVSDGFQFDVLWWAFRVPFARFAFWPEHKLPPLTVDV
jgi:hypothetical protein